MARAVAVGVDFEEGEVSGLEDDDDDPSVLEVVVVVVVVVFFLPPSSFFLLLLLQLLLDFIVAIGRDLIMFLAFSIVAVAFLASDRRGQVPKSQQSKESRISGQHINILY